MNKKTIFIFVAIVIIIAIIVIFGFKSCDPRLKEQPVNDAGQTQSDIERMNFINANVEFTCEILKNPELKTDKAQTETRVNEVFKKHSLPVEDNTKMIEILKKYQNDSDIEKTIKENAKPCASGGEPIFIK
jgi:hypothetical protein